MKTKTIKIKMLILVLVLLSSMILYASAESLQITDVQGNQLNYAVTGEKLTILVSSDKQPVAAADVYFKLNDETPVHTRTNETGMAVFKPLSPGILKITAEKNEKFEEIELRVILKDSILQIQAPSYAIKDEMLIVKVIAGEQQVADADAYFKLNEGAPVHVKTNESGIAVFKPLVTGTLKITAQKDAFEPASTSIPVFEKDTQIFDTGIGTYPSIMGTHKGEIKPSRNINVNKLYTYPCVGTGGHTETIELYENTTLIASGTGNGYQDNYHNITITPSVTLVAGHTYTYTIVTSSYPQIIHATSKDVTGGTITCTSFVDANGKTYTDWIPAIRLE
jgi:hypothetical protein